MKTKQFSIPLDALVEFAEQLLENDLTNEIIGITDDNEILITVSYSPEERQNVFGLMEWVEDHIEDYEDPNA